MTGRRRKDRRPESWEDSPQGPGRLPGQACDTHARAQKTQHFIYGSALAISKRFVIFEQGALRFHFAVGLQITLLVLPRA